MQEKNDSPLVCFQTYLLYKSFLALLAPKSAAEALPKRTPALEQEASKKHCGKRPVELGKQVLLPFMSGILRTSSNLRLLRNSCALC